MEFPDVGPVLEGLPWAVAGAAASRLYMPERATQDLDVVVLSDDAPEVRRRLRSAGLSYAGELGVLGSSWHTPGGFPVDVIEVDARWGPRALEEAQHNRDPAGMPVLPLSYLLLMKFRAGRLQDLADIARMLGQAREAERSSVRRLFAQEEPEGVEDLESLVTLGEVELGRQPER